MMRRFAVNGLVSLLSIGAALLCAEAILRFFQPQQLGVWYSLRNGLVIHPPGARIYLTNFSREIRFNALGMRDVEHGNDKAPGVYRVVVLGDSFMEALQVSLDESFSRLLERQLRAMIGTEIEVISCAVSGWGTDQQLTYLKRMGPILRPDLVVIAMTLHNDVSDNLREQFHFLRGEEVIARPAYEFPAVEFHLLKVKDFLASHSHLAQLARRYRHLGEVRTAARQLDDHVLDLLRKDESASMAKGWRLTSGLVDGVRREAETIGSRTAVFMIPLSIQIYPETLNQWLAAHAASVERVDIERPQLRMRDVGRVRGVEIVDLLPTFRAWHQRTARSLHIHGEGHWNVEGHRLAARFVAEELVRRGLIGARREAVGGE